jgi:hypothetical protein
VHHLLGGHRVQLQRVQGAGRGSGALAVGAGDPLFCAETLARIATERKWVVAVYLIIVFIVLPALVIILVGVL